MREKPLKCCYTHILSKLIMITCLLNERSESTRVQEEITYHHPECPLIRVVLITVEMFEILLFYFH